MTRLSRITHVARGSVPARHALAAGTAPAIGFMWAASRVRDLIRLGSRNGTDYSLEDQEASCTT